MPYQPPINRPEDDFRGKYESKNPIMRHFLRGFFKTLQGLLPNDLKSVLEVGCGEGFSTEHIRHFLPDVDLQASDITPELVTATQARVPSATCSVESIFALNRPDASVDLVFALEVLEHLEQPEKALAELARVTKKWAIISVPHEPLWRVMNMARGTYLKGWGNTPGHINHWTPWGFRRFVGQSFVVRRGKQPIPWTMLLLEKR
ncbi:MAG: class I SAM-dependent methyltransferase [Patescibacteria group bacterium]|jgi:ubiquinone/menaquinone biosynthesis C-methylase UbiE